MYTTYAGDDARIIICSGGSYCCGNYNTSCCAAGEGIFLSDLSSVSEFVTRTKIASTETREFTYSTTSTASSGDNAVVTSDHAPSSTPPPFTLATELPNAMATASPSINIGGYAHDQKMKFRLVGLLASLVTLLVAFPLY